MRSNKSIPTQYKQLHWLECQSKYTKQQTRRYQKRQPWFIITYTFSVKGGGTFTVSASSTLKGSSILLESVERYLPFLDAAIVLFQNNNNNKLIRKRNTFTFGNTKKSYIQLPSIIPFAKYLHVNKRRKVPIFHIT